LRFSVGEYNTEPEPARVATEHMLTFPTETLAGNCKTELFSPALDVLVGPGEGHRWQLLAVCAELAPDPDPEPRAEPASHCATLRRQVRRLAGTTPLVSAA